MASSTTTCSAKHTDGPNPPLLWHLVRCGLVARRCAVGGALSAGSGSTSRTDVTAADVIAVLRHVPEDMGVLDRGKARDYFMLTPGILSSIDELLVHAYVADAAALCGPLRPSCRARCRWRSTACVGAPAR
jgi:hypothetical protein